METEKFKIAKEISDKINSIEGKILQIDRLINSCGLSCEISGTLRNSFNKCIPYISYSKDTIIYILQNDKMLLISELDQLKKDFQLL